MLPTLKFYVRQGTISHLFVSRVLSPFLTEASSEPKANVEKLEVPVVLKSFTDPYIFL